MGESGRSGGKWLTGDSKQVLVIDAISSYHQLLEDGKCSLKELLARGELRDPKLFHRAGSPVHDN